MKVKLSTHFTVDSIHSDYFLVEKIYIQYIYTEYIGRIKNLCQLMSNMCTVDGSIRGGLSTLKGGTDQL